MYKSLRFNPNPRNVNIVPDFIYLRKKLGESVLRIKNYYRNEIRLVSVSHPLYLILHSLPVQYTGNKKDFVKAVQLATVQIAKTHKLVGSSTAGEIQSNKFVRENSTEIILANTVDFDVEDAIKNWMNLEPVKVLRHPFGDINLPVLNTSLSAEYFVFAERVNNDAVYVFEINVAMLALQYICWKEATAAVGDMKNLLNFCAAFPLPNMLESWTNISFFNRYMYFLTNFKKKRYPTTRNVHPININQLDAELDRAMLKLVTNAKHITRDFATILAELMLPFQKTNKGLLEAADNYLDTYQVTWALNLAYIPIIAGLLITDNLAPKKSSMDIKRSLSINLSRLRSGNYLRPYISSTLFLATDRYIQQNIKPYIN